MLGGSAGWAVSSPWEPAAAAPPSGAGQRSCFRGGPGAVATTTKLPAGFAAAGSWRRGRGHCCCWRSGRWRRRCCAAPGTRATEGGRGAGPGPRPPWRRKSAAPWSAGRTSATPSSCSSTPSPGPSSCSGSRTTRRSRPVLTRPFPTVDLPFQDYVEHLLHPQDPSSLGNDTLYFFGDNDFSEWASLFQHYSPPPFSLLGTTAAYSFGIAGAGSGVPFHWHGPGFSEVIYGRKRWFLYPPEKTPEFHPNKTTLAWLQDVYPTLAPSERPLECTVQAGEVLYFPDRWWHATLNLDTSVFISTFLG
ncbi:jmjC domain-containing protein 8 isoform X3 [Canis lupus baileyi]|uniref:jmjC domain-containing protein 8 isoform X3 n=1 Tax=Canis lupus dingo TaxID=286419 RepID=UPI000DC696A8|nr:jmjC domain-containing protein 8 isoform X3 [Canis lupus dingo]XP_038396832.1 jmjC domain-containing protein 8 isoform X4 [Canis lupus familiaris]XP_038407125.1 jmjC domain-containing protein 8 isoform X4 [Canis lupus familiaris]XP_038525632.1 jmjC domain-containing protein 8 isoform X4 [Canis lupus familiaris]